ncbi:DUF7832 domain-containing protein [Porcipelethomonas sp.]|uniref:DUF7832 domain-containing protein n=1 Tax=Porcipelethomonas sp. TaxID=2981675 RepID=UPI003EF73545
MGIFNIFKKKKDKTEESVKKEYTSEERSCCFDKVDYQFEAAMKNYCRMNNKNEDSLNDEDFDEIYLYAGNHIGFFMTWIIKHHFEGEIHNDDNEGLEAVRNETMTGTEFVMEHCDGKFWGIDVSDEIFGFVNEYYENGYLNDYSRWVIEELHDLPLEFVGTWEEYHEFEHVIDNAYDKYKETKV